MIFKITVKEKMSIAVTSDIHLGDNSSRLTQLNHDEQQKIIFGHTHHAYGKDNPYKSKKLPSYEFYNTGGWLQENKAEVFLMDNSRFESFTI
jgi:hypothetical protein